MVKSLWKATWQFLIKPTCNHHSNCNPAIALLDFYSIKMNVYIHIKTCACISVAGLFIIGKNWRHPKCPSVGEWLK